MILAGEIHLSFPVVDLSLNLSLLLLCRATSPGGVEFALGGFPPLLSSCPCIGVGVSRVLAATVAVKFSTRRALGLIQGAVVVGGFGSGVDATARPDDVVGDGLRLDVADSS